MQDIKPKPALKSFLKQFSIFLKEKILQENEKMISFLTFGGGFTMLITFMEEKVERRGSCFPLTS